MTGWQSQVAASAEGRRRFRHKSLAGEHCYGSNTGHSKAEHEAGGQGHPLKLATGAATCSHPPTASDQGQTLQQTEGVLCMGAGLCSEKEPLCLCSAGTQPTPQMHRLVCIISSSKCVTLVEMAIFLTCRFLQCQWKSAERGFACIWHPRDCFCAQRFCQGASGNFDKLFWVLRWPSALLDERLHITAGHKTYIISVPGFVLEHLEILVPEW